MKTLTLNITQTDLATISEIVEAVPLASRHAVARAALRLGLTAMAEDYEHALEQLVEQHQRRAND